MNIIETKRLFEIRKEMLNLLDEAKTILRQHASKSMYERAKAYWIGHIDVGLGGDEYINTYNTTLKTTLEELGVDIKKAEGDDYYFDNLESSFEESENEE